MVESNKLFECTSTPENSMFHRQYGYKGYFSGITNVLTLIDSLGHERCCLTEKTLLGLRYHFPVVDGPFTDFNQAVFKEVN